MQSRKPAGSGLQFVFYALAALALLIGLFALIGVLGFASSLEANAFLLRSMLGPLADLLFGGLRSGVQLVGVLAFVIMAGLGGVLFLAGRLTARQAGLAARVARLEEAIAALTADRSPARNGA